MVGRLRQRVASHATEASRIKLQPRLSAEARPPRWSDVRPDALVRGQSSSQVLLVATADPAHRTVVALDRDGAASAIFAIISVGAITSIVFVVVTRLRAHSPASQRSVNPNLR